MPPPLLAAWAVQGWGHLLQLTLGWICQVFAAGLPLAMDTGSSPEMAGDPHLAEEAPTSQGPVWNRDTCHTGG